MTDPTLYWTKVAAIGQVAGAFATFAAVIFSLWTSLRARKPDVRFRVGIRVIINGGEIGPKLLMFETANRGDRPAHISGLGWRTGYFRIGPAFLARQNAVQLLGGVPGSLEPPYALDIAQRASGYALLDNLLEHSAERILAPFFTRDWPLLGRRATRIRAYCTTADGHIFVVRPEANLITALVEAEKRAIPTTQAE